MEVTTLGYLARIVQNKLSQEAASPDTSLRRTLAHVNLLDLLNSELSYTRQHQKTDFDKTVVEVSATHEWKEDVYNCDASFDSDYEYDHEDYDNQESNGLIVNETVLSMIDIDDKKSCGGQLDKAEHRNGEVAGRIEDGCEDAVRKLDKNVPQQIFGCHVPSESQKDPIGSIDSGLTSPQEAIRA